MDSLAGLGSGGTGKTNVGGPSSSFGIWYEWEEECAKIAAEHDLKVVRVHTHIGSGSDPAVWQKTAGMSRALNIHTFVKSDEFLMNLSPNLIRDRRSPYLITVEFNKCRRTLRFDP